MKLLIACTRNRRAITVPLSTLALACSPLALGQTTPAHEPEIETITVISTGIRGAERTVANSPTPIDIINSEQLLKTGRAELSEALSKVLPSFNFDSNYAGFNSVHRSLTNRGLGPTYTLVLVNGKRRHNSANPARGGINNTGANAVDIDLIPVSAVERIEVLRDSAAAQYGSDAVAGVINIILKSDDSGGRIEANYGQLFSNQGETFKLAGNHGFALGDGGFLHLSADARKRGSSSFNHKADPDYRVYFEDDRQAAWNRVAIKNGDPKLEAWNLGYNAELPLSERFSLYSYGTYGVRDATAYNWWRLPNENASIPELFPDGYFPINNLEDTDYQILLGAKSELAGWDWDVSTTYGRNEIHHSSELTINPSYGPESPTSFGDLATLQFDQWVNNLDITRGFNRLAAFDFPVQLSFGLEHRWERFKTKAGDELAWSVGPYQRSPFLADGVTPNPLYERYGPQPAVGAQAALTISANDEVSVSRNNVAAYVELGLDPTDHWYIGAAGRFEHYDDDSGNTFGFKLNSRYELSESLALRGTLGTGFRAPSLTQIGYTISDNRVAADADGNIVPALTRLAATNTPLARALGATSLDPEKSRNIGFGLTWQPAHRTSVTIDAYLIDIDDRIVLSESLYDRGNGIIADILEAAGQERTTWANYYTNAFDTRTRGVDLVADHTSDLGSLGQIRWSLGFNWNKTSVDNIKGNPEQLAGSGVDLISRTREGELTVASPRTKWVVGGVWSFDDWLVSLQNTRYDKVETRAVNPSGDRTFGAKWITDLDISRHLGERIVLSLGGTNIFNVRPDKNAVYNPNGVSRYGNPPFSPAGGFWYTKVTYNF